MEKEGRGRRLRRRRGGRGAARGGDLDELARAFAPVAQVGLERANEAHLVLRRLIRRLRRRLLLLNGRVRPLQDLTDGVVQPRVEALAARTLLPVLVRARAQVAAHVLLAGAHLCARAPPAHQKLPRLLVSSAHGRVHAGHLVLGHGTLLGHVYRPRFEAIGQAPFLPRVAAPPVQHLTSGVVAGMELPRVKRMEARVGDKIEVLCRELVKERRTYEKST